MDKIKKYFRDLSFRTSFIIYVVLFGVIAFILISVTNTVCQNITVKIHESYNDEAEWYYLMSPDGEVLDEQTRVGKRDTIFSEADNRRLTVLNAAAYLCIPVYSIICLVLATVLFYRNKMKKPLTILQEAHRKISDNDLDFTIGYTSKDEMGNLCASFEKMKTALYENNTQIWRQMEQRKQLNAAFAHDLRTPLTVLKGYSEILEHEGEKQATKDTAATMTKHIGRLERYVESMSNLQKLEDMTPAYKSIDLSVFMQSIEQTAIFICESAGKQIAFQANVKNQTAVLDDEIIFVVAENLISNAARYARQEVKIDFTETDDFLIIAVNDDGNGFSMESVRLATEPYYTCDTDRASHFGLGLYISKILCEHHGGNIQLGNAEHGAFVIVSFAKEQRYQK